MSGGGLGVVGRMATEVTPHRTVPPTPSVVFCFLLSFIQGGMECG